MSFSISKDEREVIKAVLAGDNRDWPTLRFLANEPESLAEFSFTTAADADSFSGIAEALGFMTSRKDVMMLSESKGADAAKLAILTLDATAGALVEFLELRARTGVKDERWRQLRAHVLENEEALDQISPLLQLDLLHHWLDAKYGAGGWECDLFETRSKPLLQVVVFELVEKRSGRRHLLAAKGDDVEELPLAWRQKAPLSIGDAPRPLPNGVASDDPDAAAARLPPALGDTTRVDVGIITIRDDEAGAVVDRLSGEPYVSPRTSRHYMLAKVGTTLVAVAKTNGQGNVQGHSAARDLHEDFSPRWLLLVGIGGGAPSDDFSLGDVVVSTRIVDLRIEARLENEPAEYMAQGGPLHPEAANLVAGLSLRKSELKGWNSDETIRIARPTVDVSKLRNRLYGSTSWRASVKGSLETHFKKKRAPLFMAGAIASSDRLVKDATLLEGWKKHNRDVCAVEMEAAGVYVAAHEKGMRFIAIRGISDIVGLKRKAEWTAYACETPAALAVHLLSRGWFGINAHTQSGSGRSPTSGAPPVASSYGAASTPAGVSRPKKPSPRAIVDGATDAPIRNASAPTEAPNATSSSATAIANANAGAAIETLEREQKLWLSAAAPRRSHWAATWPTHAVFSFFAIPKNAISMGSHSDLRTTVHKARVDAVGLTFPSCVEDRFTTIQNRPSAIQGVLDLGDYQEVWQLHSTGPFWYTSLVRAGAPRAPGELSIEFEVVPWMIGLALRFVRRLFAPREVDRLSYAFMFDGMKGRRLVSFKPNKLRNQYKTEEERIEIVGSTTLDALKSDWRKPAGDAVREIFALFNWEIESRVIVQELDEVRGGD